MGKKIMVVGLLVFIFGASFVLVGRLFSESETVLAKVGDAVITQRDLDEFMSKFAYIRKNKPYSPEEKKEMLSNLVKEQLVYTEAEKEKLDRDPAVATKLRMYRHETLVQEYLTKKIQPNVTITDEHVEEVFKTHPSLLPGKETLLLKEILVKTEKEADAIYEDLKKGTDFSKIALESSKADSRINGGSMKPVYRGQLPKELEDVAFNLKKGEFSKPFKTGKGYYILFLAERKEKSSEEMEKLTKSIKEKVKQIEISKKAQEMLEKRAEELKDKTNVEVFYDRIQ